MSLWPFTAVKPATCRCGRLPLWSQQHVAVAVYRGEASNMSLWPFTAVKPATCRCGRLPLWSQQHVAVAVYRCREASDSHAVACNTTWRSSLSWDKLRYTQFSGHFQPRHVLHGTEESRLPILLTGGNKLSSILHCTQSAFQPENPTRGWWGSGSVYQCYPQGRVHSYYTYSRPHSEKAENVASSPQPSRKRDRITRFLTSTGTRH